MAIDQEYKERRVNNLPTSGLSAGDKYALNVGGGKYQTYIVSDTLQLVKEAGADFIEKDTMAEMRALSAREIWALQNGYYKGVGLSGYYQKGDTPGRIEYFLSDTIVTDDGGSVIAVGGVKLEHIFVGEINPKYFGAKDDDNFDSTAHIQACLNYGENRSIRVSDGTYRIQAANKLIFKSNTYIFFEPKAVFKALPSWRDISSVLEIVGVDNVQVYNPKIIGDRYLVDFTTEGAGHGISIRGSSNVQIYCAEIKDCFTDGIYTTGVEDVFIQSSICDNNRRQGMSITGAKNFICRDSVFKNTNGVPPAMGIDIEPNNANDLMENIYLSNITTINNQTYGIGVNLNKLNNTSNIVSITIDGWTDFGSGSGFSAHCYQGVTSNKGLIQIKDAKLYNNKNAGVTVLGYRADNSPRLYFDNPYIYNCNVDNGTNERHQNVAFSISSDTSGYPTGEYQGNVHVKNITIDMPNDRSIMRGIYVGFNNPYKNITIENPLKINIGDLNTLSANNNRNLISFANQDSSGVKILDSLGVLKANTNNAITLFRNYDGGIYSNINIQNTSGSIVLRDFVKWSIIENLVVTHDGVNTVPLTIELPTTVTFIDDTNTVINGKFESTIKNSKLRFTKIVNNVFRVTEEYGVWVNTPLP